VGEVELGGDDEDGEKKKTGFDLLLCLLFVRFLTHTDGLHHSLTTTSGGHKTANFGSSSQLPNAWLQKASHQILVVIGRGANRGVVKG
jgi:hypothetical protein